MSRNSYLFKTYGITEQQYNELRERQEYCCAICKRHESLFKRKLCVDHSHRDSQVRGLLCNHCNLRIVGRNNNSELLRRAADYIDQGTGWYVPKKKPKKRKK